MPTKEEIIKTTSEDELFALIHTFIWRFNEVYSPDVIQVTDQQIGEVIEGMKKAYQ